MKRIVFATVWLASILTTLAVAQIDSGFSKRKRVAGQADISLASSAELVTTGLIISEYIEGSASNKAIEIYNGTGASVDLAAGNYVLELYTNGSTVPNQSMNLDGTIANGDVYVIAHPSASLTILAQADNSSLSVINFNGDDVVVLRRGGAAGTIVDVFGQVGVDPGTEWGTGVTSTSDNTLVRKSTVCAGDTISNDAFDPATQWNGFVIDTFSSLGSHTAACSPTAANVVLAGRIVTSEGQGIRNVVVTLQGGTLGEPRQALTGAFGYYAFEDLPVGETYVVSVKAKRFTFANPTRVINLNTDLTDADFVAEPTW